MDSLLALSADPAAWVALVTLIVMEVVLGIDNLIFISILTNKLPEARRATARPGLMLLGKLVGENGDEDQVVDAEHDLHDDEGDEGCPGSGIAEEGQQISHHGSIFRFDRKASQVARTCACMMPRGA